MSKNTRTQRHILLERLMEAQEFGMYLDGRGGWITIGGLIGGAFIGQYNARIKELREVFEIEQKFFDKVSHYRLKTPKDMIELDNLKIVNKKQTALPL